MRRPLLFLFMLAVVADAQTLTWDPPYPRQVGGVMLGWARESVHKVMGRPVGTFEPGAGETPLDVNRSFKVEAPIEDVWTRKTASNEYEVRIAYNYDPNESRWGSNQRSSRITLMPRLRPTLWALMSEAKADLPEAAAICHGACSVYRVTEPGGEYAIALPTQPTEEQNILAVLVATGYKPYETGERWAPGMRLRLTSGSWDVERIEIVPLGMTSAVKPGPEREVKRVGLWKVR